MYICTRDVRVYAHYMYNTNFTPLTHVLTNSLPGYMQIQSNISNLYAVIDFVAICARVRSHKNVFEVDIYLAQDFGFVHNS